MLISIYFKPIHGGQEVKGNITCRLPRGQYSVTMQMLGGSMQAPMNLVRWLN